MRKARQLPFSFNNDQDVKRVRDGIRKNSSADLRLAAAAIDHELSRRAQLFKKQETKEALAGFLDNISFDYFCTFTTRRPVSLFATRRIAEKVCQRVDAGHTASVFWAAEAFELRDGFHFHALMKLPVIDSIGVLELPRDGRYLKMDLWDWYFKKYGRCQIIDNREPDRQLAASHYISKYVTKRITDYDLVIAKQHLL